MSEKPDYGVDGARLIAALLVIAALLLVAAGFAMAWESPRVGAPLAALSLAPLALGLLGLRSAWVGQLALRDQLLDRVAWKGSERTLDVGCDSGLMLVGAARRAPRGRATGVPLAQPERALRNADLERVHERVEVRAQPLPRLDFGDGDFDVVLSVGCLHRLPAAGRDALTRELGRVLKPGGVLLLSDRAHTGRCAQLLREEGLTVTRSGLRWTTFPPQRRIEARKGAALGYKERP
jgi:SAM-dependent methyltransferase